MKTTYTPVAYEYKEVIEEEMKKGTRGKVFYFDDVDAVESFEGRIVIFREAEGWLVMEPFIEIRIDRIITLFGKPGPAYDEYDAFANACMDCSGGME